MITHENIAILAIGLVMIVACNRKDKTISKENSKATSVKAKKDSVIASPNQRTPRFEFIPAQASDSGQAIKFIPKNFPINWQAMVPEKYQPKSLKNPDGIDPNTLTFGDFGHAVFASTLPYQSSSSDSLFYYLIQGERLHRIHIDSLEAKVFYDDNGTCNFYGHLIGYSDSVTKPASFVIQSKLKKTAGHIEITKLKEEAFELTQNPEKPDKNGFYDGPFVMKVNYKGEVYQGYGEEDSINFKESMVIEVADQGLYIVASWIEGGALCAHYYTLYKLSNGKMKKLITNSYGCDI